MHTGGGTDIYRFNLVHFEHFIVIGERTFDTPLFFRTFKVCRDNVGGSDNLGTLDFSKRLTMCSRDTTRPNQT